MMKIILTILFIGLIVSGLVTYKFWYQDSLMPVDSDNSASLYVEIQPGMSSAEIADLLEKEGVIRDSIVFRSYLRIKGLSGDLMAGFYDLNKSLSSQEIAGILTEGITATNIVRIPSGKTLTDIKQIMINAGFKEADINKALTADYKLSLLGDKPSPASLEGYLFPDTYHVGLNASARDLVIMILTHADSRITPEIRAGWRKQGLNIHEGLTLASIVQREMSKPEEQQKAAQVFLKRLKLGMRLDADPTFVYAANQKGVKPSPDLDSPYNTYRVVGLPPGPIGNSEMSPILAVAQPAKTNYLYFVTGKDGVTRFSKTEAEHLSLIEKHGISGQ